MLLPSLNKAREASKKSVCTNNIRQAHLNTEIYILENDSYYPYASYEKVTWDDLTSHYLNDSDRAAIRLDKNNHSKAVGDIFTCPSDTKRNEANGNSIDIGDRILRSYSLNGGGGDYKKKNRQNFRGLGNEKGISIKPSQVKNPSEFLAVAETIYKNYRGQSAYSSTRRLNHSYRYTSLHKKEYYNNYSFADGHIEFTHVEIAVQKEMNE